MNNFDDSIGIPKKNLGTIKYITKKYIEKQIPTLNENIELQLFFQGRDAWTYRWQTIFSLSEQRDSCVTIQVTAKLKKEFHKYIEKRVYQFVCEVFVSGYIYDSKVLSCQCLA